MTEEVAPYKVNIPDMSDTPRKVFKPGPGWTPWTMDGAAFEVRKFMVAPDGWTALELTPTGWEPANGVVLAREGRRASPEEASQWSVPG